MSVYSVNVYPSSTTIKTGNWYYGAYAIVNASSNCNTDVTWYSDKTSVATVNASSGYIYAKAPGTAKIYARSTIDSSKKDYITVTVTSGTICVDSVTLNRSSISLEKGDTFTLSATVCPTNATNKSIGWRSSNTSVATVSGGVVTAKARGYAYIYAEAQDGSGEYDSCYVNVTEDILVTSVTVSPSSKIMNIGNSAYLYETVCPTNATNKCVKWSSNKTSVATVNPDTGLVIAQGAGTATITATAQDGSNKKGYCTITVNPPIAVTGVEICPTSLTMNVGDIEYLCASITPSNATNQTVTWCSSNENVATVGLYTGRISANMAGITTITATTADGGFTASCNVSVKQVLKYPDNLISNTSTRNAILKLKNIRDETVNAYLNGVISCDAMEKATQKIDYEINLARADYIAVGTNPFSDYAYAILGGDKSAAIPYPFKRNLYYRSSNPFNGLDVMVVQRVLELYGYYEHDSDSMYGTWDQATQDAALNWLPLLSVVGDERVFDYASFYVLFQADNVSKRTYEAMRLLQQFNLQHKQVQIKCMESLRSGGTLSRIEMPIKGGSISGRTGRADVVGKTIGGTYVWEVKHNSTSAIAAGDAQVQRYIAASQTVPEQDAFYPKNLDSLYELPLIAGPSIFAPTAIPWYGKYLLYKSYVSLNPYRNALVVYEESDTIPDGYVYVEEPVAVEVPEPEASYAFNFTGVYNTLTNYGEAIVRGMQIDPQTGAILVTVFVAGAMCLLTLGALAFA